ncbi:LLM class flavin-dependent oxidoreductase, partial [Burkholderia gladioli]|uniref:LLM class flavin-dependent oxidoreductase n=1 Tax=Burkholderia gladioli TaxID=28095 RepID=UPI001ABA31C2
GGPASFRPRHAARGASRWDSAVILLPLEAPLRVAEDTAVLDVLSIGRVQLRLGSGGANTDAFSAFGIDAGTRQTRSTAS